MKNAEGVDSPATCRRDQIRRAARWLARRASRSRRRGWRAGRALEISPLFATTAEQLKQRNPKVSLCPSDVVYFDSSGIEGSA